MFKNILRQEFNYSGEKLLILIKASTIMYLLQMH